MLLKNYSSEVAASVPGLTGLAVLAPDAAGGERLRSACEARGLPVALALPLNGALASHVDTLQGLAALIADVGTAATAPQALRELRELCAPTAQILLVVDRADLALARELRRQGASEVFARNAEHDELLTLAGEILGHGVADSARRGTRVLAVHGVCGGAGAGLVSAGLATLLAATHGRRTALVDLNTASPTAGSWLGCDKPGELFRLLRTPERIDGALLEQASQRPHPQLALLDGQGTLTEFSDVGAGACRSLSQALAAQYRYQVWRSSGMDAAAAHSLAQADLRLLVCDATLPALRAARALLPQLTGAEGRAQTLLVFNARSPEGVFDADAFAEALGRPADIVLPYRAKLARQQLDGVPFNAPNHALHREFSALAARVLGLPVPAQRPWWRLR